MLAFLGWVSVLHFGPNKSASRWLASPFLLETDRSLADMYPFFAFADNSDPYNYHLTMLGSLAIWASELVSSFVARQVSLLWLIAKTSC